jgi:hypothetical protein
MAERRKRRKSPRLTPKSLAIKNKEKRAVEMRLAGVEFKDIAAALGYTCGSSAHKAVKRAMAEQIQEPTAQLRQMEVARLDRMLTALWPKVLEGKWLAHDRALKVMERKAALLGLDAPQRRIVDVITHDAFTKAMQEREQRVQELRDASPAQIEAGEEDYTLPEDDIAEDEDITDVEMVEVATTEEPNAESAAQAA